MKKVLCNILLLLGAVFLSLLIAEGVSRLVYSPDDYLKPEIIEDEWGVRVKPDSRGHDSWGFRNRSVPPHADIVTIGDSNTYGNAAIRSETWPALLSTFTDKMVYNMGNPGYGPVAYAHLLREKALQLSPSMVIVGFYLGNDAWGAYKAVYRQNLAPYLKKPGYIAGSGKGTTDTDTLEPAKVLPLGHFRWWLSGNSVLYNVARYSEVGVFLMNKIHGGTGNGYAILEDSKNNIHTALQPQGLRAVNLDDDAVREGLRISLALLSDMNDVCRREGITFMVVLIPTKVAVYAGYIEKHPDVDYYHQLIRSIDYERRINELIKGYLGEHGIPYLDALPALQAATAEEQVYPANGETHPNRNGYRIIARIIADDLARQQGSVNRGIEHERSNKGQ